MTRARWCGNVIGDMLSRSDASRLMPSSRPNDPPTRKHTFDVPPAAFRPPPKVDSAVVRLVPHAAEDIGIDDPEHFANVVRAAFGQRRKTLRNALMGVCTTEQIEAAGLRADARAEQVEVAGFVRLANLLATG